MTRINMDNIAAALRDEHGLSAYVEMTGGGVATIYAGPTREEDGCVLYAAIAGPGTFGWKSPSLADSDDFYIGPDDMGESEPVATDDLGIHDEKTIAALIAAQAKRSDPSQPLTAEELASLGFGVAKS